MNGSTLTLGLVGALAAAGALSRRGSLASHRLGRGVKALAVGPVRAEMDGFRWRKIGSGEFVLERADVDVVVSTQNREDLYMMPEDGWRQMYKLDNWYNTIKVIELAQNDDGSFLPEPSEPKVYSSLNRACRAAERRAGAPKMEVLWR